MADSGQGDDDSIMASSVHTVVPGAAASNPASSLVLSSVPDTVSPKPPPLQCCCGRVDCVFLRHSSTVLEGVEKDVHTAAKLGQVSISIHIPRPDHFLALCIYGHIAGSRFSHPNQYHIVIS